MKKIVAFGELLMRLSPPKGKRFSQTQQLDIHFGGAEANVAASVSNFGLEAKMVSVLPPDHDLAEEAIRYLKKWGVDTQHILRKEGRYGTYYAEGASMQRGGKVIYDRAGSSFTLAEPSDFDWEKIFEGATWFHWSGITPAVSENAALICKQAIEKANELGLKVSMDYNFRAKLWKWGKTDTEVMPELMKGCHVMSGTHPDVDVLKEPVPDEAFAEEGRKLMQQYPRCEVVVFSSRGVHSANHHTWEGILWDGQKIYRSNKYELTHIVDRVGGGDSFMAAIVYALNTYEDLQDVINFATASSALKHGIEGDFNPVSRQEVIQLMDGNGKGKIVR